MGLNQSNTTKHHESQDTRTNMTFDQFLDTISQKADDLLNTLKNLKEERGKEGGMLVREAGPYLADILNAAERELHHLNACIIAYIHPAKQQKGREQHIDQARLRYLEQERQKQVVQERARYKEHHHTGTPKETSSVFYTSDLQKQLEDTTAELSISQKTVEELRTDNKALKANVDKLAKLNQELRSENGNLLHRLSKLTSDKLTADNPNIADLSDPNRPTKLVEMMSELYDNQWTDAYEALRPLKNDDRLVVKILLHTFMDIYDFCKDKSRSLFSMSEKTMKELFEDVNKTIKEKDRIANTKSATLCPANGKEMAGLFREQSFAEANNKIFFHWEHGQAENALEESGSFKVAKDVWPKLEWELKKVKKDFGVAMVPIVTKAYLQPRWSKTCVKELKPYIKRCFDVAWMMCVQTPPMALAALPRQGDVFDATLYTAYSKRGNKVDFVVWPAVLLKEKQFGENAAVMRKGVADGKD